jgi:hypothetical protein
MVTGQTNQAISLHVSYLRKRSYEYYYNTRKDIIMRNLSFYYDWTARKNFFEFRILPNIAFHFVKEEYYINGAIYRLTFEWLCLKVWASWHPR